MGNTYSQIFIHLVFSTKERKPNIRLEFEEKLKTYIYNSAKDHEIQVLAVGGTQDHLHVLVMMPPKFPVSKAVQIIKGSSSRWLNKYHFDDYKFRWQRGYGAFSINKSLLPKTINYIQNQKDHHTDISFQDEFTSFLEKHNIDYNKSTLFS